MPDHRHERHDARSARDEEEWPADRGLPHEVAPDRAAHLEAVTGHEDVVEERRDLAVGIRSTLMSISPLRSGSDAME